MQKCLYVQVCCALVSQVSKGQLISDHKYSYFFQIYSPTIYLVAQKMSKIVGE